jgi:hypothetical protein
MNNITHEHSAVYIKALGQLNHLNLKNSKHDQNFKVPNFSVKILIFGY